MEITLEKIELVKDRTGVSYKEAKEALEAADGSVVDAIIAIEETVNIKQNSKVNDVADETIAKIKELVKKGNVTKISVKRDDETIVNIPVNVGIVGTIVAPWGIIAAAIAAFGFRCQIEEKGSVVVDEVVAKGSAVANDVKEKAPDVMNDIKEKSVGAYNTVKNAATDMWNGIKEKKEDIEDDIEEAFDIAEEKLDDIVEDIEK